VFCKTTDDCAGPAGAENRLKHSFTLRKLRFFERFRQAWLHSLRFSALP